MRPLLAITIVCATACGHHHPATVTNQADAPARAGGPSPCAADPTPLASTDAAYVGEIEEGEGDTATLRLAHGATGIRCTRSVYGGEQSATATVTEETIGGTPVVLVVDDAASTATCDAEDGSGETERCEFSTTTIWLFSRDLQFVTQLTDESGGAVSVANGELVIGAAHRVLRDGALVAP